MARKRKKKGDMDRLANLLLICKLNPQGRLAREVFKAIYQKYGPEFVVSALTPEQRQEWIRELQCLEAAERSTVTPPKP